MKKHWMWIVPLLVVVLALSWFFYFRHLPVFNKIPPQTTEVPTNNDSLSFIQQEANKIIGDFTGEKPSAIFKIKDIQFSITDIEQEERRLKTPDFDATMSKIPEKDQQVYRSKLRTDAIANLLNRIYIELYIKENNIVITEKYVQEVMKEFEDLMRKNSENPEQFNLEQHLSSMNISMSDYRRDMTNQAKFKIVTTPLTDKLPVANEQEIKTYWESHKEMFNDPPSADIDVLLTDSEEKVDQAMTLLKGGATWENACAKYSNLPAEQTKLGLMPKDRMPQEMADIVFSSTAKVKGCYKVNFMTQWYVVKINSLQQGLVRTYEEARGYAEEALMNEKKRDVVEEFLKGLSEKYGTPQRVK